MVVSSERCGGLTLFPLHWTDLHTNCGKHRTQTTENRENREQREQREQRRQNTQSTEGQREHREQRTQNKEKRRTQNRELGSTAATLHYKKVPFLSFLQGLWTPVTYRSVLLPQTFHCRSRTGLRSIRLSVTSLCDRIGFHRNPNAVQNSACPPLTQVHTEVAKSKSPLQFGLLIGTLKPSKSKLVNCNMHYMAISMWTPDHVILQPWVLICCILMSL